MRKLPVYGFTMAKWIKIGLLAHYLVSYTSCKRIHVDVNLVISEHIYRMQYFALKTDMKPSNTKPLKLCVFFECTENGVFKNEGQCLNTDYETNTIVICDLNRQLCAQ